jgi:hypothetical protein
MAKMIGFLAISIVLVASILVSGCLNTPNMIDWKHIDRNETNYTGPIRTYEISLKSGSFTPVPGVDENLRRIMETTTLERLHVFIQFEHVPLAEDRERLKNMNITLMDYVHTNTYTTSLPVNKIYEIAEDPYVLWIGAILPRDKTDSDTLEGKFNVWSSNPDETVNLSVDFFDDVSLSDAEKAIKERYNGHVEYRWYILNSLGIVIKKEFVINLIQDEIVKYVMQHGPPAVNE